MSYLARVTTRTDRLLRTLARRLLRSRRLAERLAPRHNQRGDRLDPQLALLLRLQGLAGAALAPDADVRAMRQALVRSVWLASPDPVDVPTREAVVAGLPVRFHEPVGAEGTLVFLHGGGWVVGNVDAYDPFTRQLALRTNRVVVSVEYPLAPETPFPGAIHAVADLFRALRAERSGEILLGGDSAGANLTINVTRVLRDAGDPVPERQILIYPAVDPHCASDSHREFTDGFILTADSIRKYLDLYRLDPDSVLGNPLVADGLEGLPPALVVVAGFDPLRDEGLAYAERLRAAGVPVELLDEGALTHGFVNMDGLLDEAGRANERLFAAIRRG